jgi:hypothetical protein
VTHQAVLDLFAQLPDSEKDVVWLADQVLSVAQHAGPVELSAASFGGRQPTPLRRLFRPLLARLAKAAADETGTQFDPYHGRYTLTRAARDGTVRLEIAITNTPGEQCLCIQRVPVSSPRGPAVLAPVSTPPTTQQQSAG